MWPCSRPMTSALVEVVADEAQAALGVELLAVEGDDAAGLLAAMLQGVQAERGEGRRVLVAENTEDPAFLAESVVAVAQIAWALKLRIVKLSGLVEPLSHRHLPLVPCRCPIDERTLTLAVLLDQLARTCHVTEI